MPTIIAIDTTSLHNKKYRTYRPSPKNSEGNIVSEQVNPPESTEVYHWPEFKAFAKRLGIAYKKLTTKLTITLDCDCLVRVAHDYHGEERHLPQEEAADGK